MSLSVSDKSALSGGNSSWVKQPAIESTEQGLTAIPITVPLTRATTGTQIALVLPSSFPTASLVALTGFTSLVGTGSSASVVLSIKNGSTATTGGTATIVLADTDTLGEPITFSAITAANSFTGGDTLNVVLTVGTAFTAGAIDMLMWFSGTAGSEVVQALRETRIINDSDN